MGFEDMIALTFLTGSLICAIFAVNLTSIKEPFKSALQLLFFASSLLFIMGGFGSALQVANFSIGEINDTYVNAAGDTMTGDLNISGASLFVDNLHVQNMTSSMVFMANDSSLDLTTFENQSLLFNMVNQNESSGALIQWGLSNDAEVEFACAVGSSSFIFNGVSFGNITFCTTTKDWTFGTWDNDEDLFFLGDYEIRHVIDNGSWWNDSSGNELANIDGKGNLNIEGNFTGNQLYGSMWNHSDGTYNITISSTNVKVNITGGMAYEDLNGFLFSDTPPRLTAKINGTYLAHYSMSFGGGGNSEYTTDLIVANTALDECHTHRKLGGGGDIGNTNGVCIFPMEANDEIYLTITDQANPAQDVQFEHFTLTVRRIGN